MRYILNFIGHADFPGTQPLKITNVFSTTYKQLYTYMFLRQHTLGCISCWWNGIFSLPYISLARWNNERVWLCLFGWNKRRRRNMISLLVQIHMNVYNDDGRVFQAETTKRMIFVSILYFANVTEKYMVWIYWANRFFWIIILLSFINIHIYDF